MGANESAPAPAVWPPDWNKLTEPQRKIARNAILKLSALPADEFMGFATHHAAIRCHTAALSPGFFEGRPRGR